MAKWLCAAPRRDRKRNLHKPVICHIVNMRPKLAQHPRAIPSLSIDD